MPLKLLDYGKPNPFGEIIGKPRKLAYPVNAYRVTLPKPDKDGGLNMFERVILKIIDACGTKEADALSQEICIPVELVQFILLRLRDKTFIDENNEILNQQRDKWMKEKEPVYITAMLFRELATGKILPFLHWLDNENPLRKKEGEENSFWTIRWKKSYMNRKPDTHDVILALRAMKKRLITSGDYSRFPAIKQIIIADEPEQYYLDCPIAIQKSDGEFRIADPFGNGFSLLLEKSFDQLLEQDDNLKDWFMNWKQGLSNPKPNKPVAPPKEPFDNDKNWGRYRNLVSNMRIKQNTQYHSIEQIHSALEWALFYACTQRQYDAAVRRIRLINQIEHSSLLKETAKKIGLDSPQNGFNPIPEGKLYDFLDGKAEMATVISIMLLMAENDLSHPLHKIANRHQDFITRLFDIKKKRDTQAHGKGKVQKGVKLTEDEDAFMREIVTALLPDIRFTDIPIAAVVDKDFDADIMLDSRTNIQNEFGFKYFNQLETDLQDRLIYAERFWLSCNDGDDACTFVCDLYAALQAMFRKKLAGVLPPEINNSEFIKCAQKKAMQAELGKLPGSLQTVDQLKIRRTLQGDDQTLGSCAVAFLLVSNEDSLHTIFQFQPFFLSDVADIITRRGHGNETIPMKKEEIFKLRKSVYLTIKTLLEV